MHEQTVVSIKDLRFATLACAHCHTRITLDLELEFEVPGRPRFLVPRQCPRCSGPLDSAVPSAIEAVQKVYKALVDLRGALTFSGEPFEE